MGRDAERFGGAMNFLIVNVRGVAITAPKTPQSTEYRQAIEAVENSILPAASHFLGSSAWAASVFLVFAAAAGHFGLFSFNLSF